MSRNKKFILGGILFTAVVGSLWHFIRHSDVSVYVQAYQILLAPPGRGDRSGLRGNQRIV